MAQHKAATITPHVVFSTAAVNSKQTTVRDETSHNDLREVVILLERMIRKSEMLNTSKSMQIFAHVANSGGALFCCFAASLCKTYPSLIARSFVPRKPDAALKVPQCRLT